MTPRGTQEPTLLSYDGGRPRWVRLRVRKTCSGYGPSFHAERGGFLLHVGCRYFTLPWQHGWGAWFTLRVRDRYVAFWRRGA
jgi:hypothetical protein